MPKCTFRFFLQAYEISDSGLVMLSNFTILRLTLSLTSQGAGLPVWKKFNCNVSANCETI